MELRGQRLIEFLKTKMAEGFFGRIEVSFEKGKVTDVEEASRRMFTYKELPAGVEVDVR